MGIAAGSMFCAAILFARESRRSTSSLADVRALRYFPLASCLSGTSHRVTSAPWSVSGCARGCSISLLKR